MVLAFFLVGVFYLDGCINLLVGRFFGGNAGNVCFKNICVAKDKKLRKRVVEVLGDVAQTRAFAVPSRIFRKFSYTHVSHRRNSFAFYASTSLSIDTSR